jgi:hypothetical protein
MGTSFVTRAVADLVSRWMKVAGLRIVELICFLAALGFLIPPVASDAGFPYRATPALIIGQFLFATSLLLSWWRAAEHWIAVAIKLVVYLLLVWIAYDRAVIPS